MNLGAGLKLTVAAGLAFVGMASSAFADLYVVRVGDGSAVLSSASTAAFVDKFADAGGSPTSTIALPTAGGDGFSPLTLSGTATSEGFVALSTNGQYLTLGGYGAAPGVPTIPQTDSSAVNRVIGRIEVSSGTVNTSTALSDAFIGVSGSNANIRSVVSTNGTDLWVTGTGAAATTASAGIRYTTLESTTSTQLTSTPTNVRVANISDGQLYISTASGSFVGVNSVGTGTPTAGGETTTRLPGFEAATGTGTASPYDFWFKDASTLYVADDRTQASGGGIQKWTESGGTWSLAYTLAVAPTGASNSGARGLAGGIEGSDTVLYATTSAASANRLVKVVDTGAGSAYVDLATAMTNTVFRGVEFVSTSTPIGLPGDFNGDDVVDAADYTVWRDNLDGDSSVLNGNGTGAPTVVPADYDLWKANFGEGGPGSGGIAAGAVPEPSSAVLMLVAIAGLAAGRRSTR